MTLTSRAYNTKNLVRREQNDPNLRLCKKRQKAKAISKVLTAAISRVAEAKMPKTKQYKMTLTSRPKEKKEKCDKSHKSIEQGLSLSRS